MGSVTNFTKNSVDSSGRYLLGSDNILAVYNYDSSNEAWTKDFSGVAEPVVNPLFETLISGTSGGWLDTSSATVSGSYTVSTSFSLFAEAADIVRTSGAAINQSSYVWSHEASQLVKWPAAEQPPLYTVYPWTTSSGWGWMSVDFGSPVTFDTLMFEWWGHSRFVGRDPINCGIKGWHLDVSDDAVAYTTLVSGEAYENQLEPIYVELSSTTKQYLKFYIDNNWGGVRTGLSEFGVFNRADISRKAAIVWGSDFDTAVYQNYGAVSQTVNLTGVDRVFFDFGGFTKYAATSTLNRVELYVDGVKEYSNWGSSEAYGAGTGFAYYGYSVDTSALGSAVDLELRLYTFSNNQDRSRASSYAWIAAATVSPTWFREPASTTRSAASAFPEKALLVVDGAGFSILDAFGFDDSGIPEPTLWMRFNYNTGLLDFSFTSVSAKDGKIYLTSPRGLFILDFPNDRIDRYSSAGHERITGLSRRQDAISGLLTNTEPHAQTISTASTSKLPDDVVTAISVDAAFPDDFVLGGTPLGAFTLVSGTVYRSKHPYPVTSISCDINHAVFALGHRDVSSLAAVWDVSKLGYSSFEYDSFIYNELANTNVGFSDSNWTVSDGVLYGYTVSSGVLTVSGTPTTLSNDGNHFRVWSAPSVSPSPIRMDVDVRIRNWPTDCPGELRFGVFQNEAVSHGSSLVASPRGVFMSARNSYSVPFYSDAFDDGQVQTDNYFLSLVQTPGYVNYMYDSPTLGGLSCLVAGNNRTGNTYSAAIADKDFIVRFKHKVYEYTGSSQAYFAVSTDQGGVALGGNQLQFMVDCDTQQYLLRSVGSPTSAWETLPFFGDEGTKENALFHDIYLHFTSATKTMVAYVDGIYLGTATLTTLGTAYFTMNTDATSATAALHVTKDLTMDYYNLVKDSGIRQYTVGRKTGKDIAPDGSVYIWGSSNDPYELEVVGPSFTTEGTEGEDWKTWTFFYEPSSNSYTGFLDGVFIGASQYPTAGVASPAPAIDIQFFPVTTLSGQGELEVDFRNFSVRPYNASVMGLPSSLFNVSSATISGEILSLASSSSFFQGDVYDAVILTGSTEGVSKTAVRVPTFPVGKRFSFDDASVPSSWVTKDFAGSTGSSTWTVSSGTLKQIGGIAGHGGSLTSSQKERGPFGSHLVTDVTTGFTEGAFVGVPVRTTATGTYGLSFNAGYVTDGTITTASGYFAVFGQSEFRAGQFSSEYNSSGPVYNVSYDVMYLDTSLGTHKTGVQSVIGLKTTSAGVGVFIDGTPKITFVTSGTYAAGVVGLVSNGNEFSEFTSVYEIVSGTLSTAVEKTTLAASSSSVDYPVLYGNQNTSYALFADDTASRSEGLFLAGTSDPVPRWLRIPVSLGGFGNAWAISTIVYEPSNNELLIFKIEYTNKYYVFRFSLDSMSWVGASSELASLNLATTLYNSSGRQGPWIPVIAEPGQTIATPWPHNFLYHPQRDGCSVYDIREQRAVRWGSLATTEDGVFITMDLGRRPDGFGTWNTVRGTGGIQQYSAVRRFSPVFDWSLGRVVLGMPHGQAPGDGGGLRDRFIYLHPDKHHSWSWGSSGDFSYSLNDQGLPPFTSASPVYSAQLAYSPINETLYFIASTGVWALRRPLNAFELVASLPSGVSVSSASNWVIAACYADKEGAIFMAFGSSSWVYKFDVLTEEFTTSTSFPGTFYLGHNSMTYDEGNNRMFVLPSVSSSQYVYMYTFGARSNQIGYVSSSGVLPENASTSNARFIWRGPEQYLPTSDSWNVAGGMTNKYWKSTISGTTFPSPFEVDGYVGAGGLDSVRVYSKSYGPGATRGLIGGLSSRVGIPSLSFTASIQARVTEFDQQLTTDEAYLVFGVGSGAVSLSSYDVQGDYNNTGYNGLYLGAMNNATYPSRYTLIKRDGSTTTNTAATSYSTFQGTDGTWDADFKSWTIAYNALTKTLVGTVSGTELGSVTLGSDLHTMFLELGYFSPTVAGGGYKLHTIEAKQLTIDANAGVLSRSIGTGKLVVNKNVGENGDYYYNKLVPTLISGTDFCYEAQVRATSFTTTNTPYVFSVGRVSDGYKDINLCAIDDAGTKKLSFWTGLDPWTTSSGFSNAFSYDWTIDSVYRVVNASGTVSVYIDDIYIPTLATSYESFPTASTWYNRGLSFGVIELPKDRVTVIDACIDWGIEGREAGMVSVSGTWARNMSPMYAPTACNSWYGGYITRAADVGNYDETVEFNFPAFSGKVYVYYQAGRTGASTDTPITIYSQGVLEAPVADSYATNNINTVYANTTHSGTAAAGATTIDLNDTKTANGATATGLYQGLVYLGCYSSPTRAVITPDASSTLNLGTMFLYRFDPLSRLRTTSSTSWTYIKFEEGVQNITADAVYGVSFVDSSDFTVIDSYGDGSDPALTDGKTNSVTKL